MIADAELDGLLDDALADFEKEPSVDGGAVHNAASTSQVAAPIKIFEDNDKATGGQNPPSLQPPTDVFNQFFNPEVSERLQEEWESAMKELAEEDPQLASQLKNISSTLENATAENLSAGGASSNVTSEKAKPKPKDINEAMQATISGMQKSADELKNMTGASAEEKLLKDMKNMGLGLGGLGDMMGEMGDMEGLEGNFMKMMEGMMENLLSKDILYPVMKQISGIYPDWLESNKGKVAAADFHKYTRQSVIIEKICENFESENASDAEEVKKQRLNSLMNLVEEMQECGNPPPQLMESCGGSPAEVEKIFGGMAGPGGGMFNPNDMNPENCAVM